MMSGFDLPLKAMRTQISCAVNLIVQACACRAGREKSPTSRKICGMEQDTIVMQDIYRYVQDGIDEMGRAFGRFVSTGVRPKFIVGWSRPASACRPVRSANASCWRTKT